MPRGHARHRVESRHRMSPLKPLAAIALLLAVLWALLTWPQAAQMQSVPDEGDPLLNAWALSWVAHQTPIAPARLAHANIFFPERYTLLYSESLILPGLLLAPLQWAGVNPVVVYNVGMALGMILSGLGVALLVIELTGDAWAAMVAAVAFAFLPFRFDHYWHMQLQQTACVPLALWALHRWYRRGAVRDGVWLGLCVAGQFYACVYFGVLLLPVLAVVAFVYAVALGRALRTRLAAAVAALLVCGAVVALLGSAYLRATQIVGERSRDEALAGSAHLTDYLAAPRNSRLYAAATQGWGSEERRLFPGLTIVALAGIGLWRRRALAPWAYAVALVVAVDVSLGFHGLSYAALFKTVGLFRGIRVPARMGLLVGFALSVLAAFGVQRLRDGLRSPWARQCLPMAACLAIVVESSGTPIALARVPDTEPPGYAALRRDAQGTPTAVVADLPLTASMPTFMYYSTFHWQQLVTGYSGFFPPSYFALARDLEQFPDASALDALRARQARYVVLHGEVYPPEQYAALAAKADASPALALVSRTLWRGGEMRVYRLLPAPRGTS